MPPEPPKKSNNPMAVNPDPQPYDDGWVHNPTYYDFGSPPDVQDATDKAWGAGNIPGINSDFNAPLQLDPKDRDQLIAGASAAGQQTVDGAKNAETTVTNTWEPAPPQKDPSMPMPPLPPPSIPPLPPEPGPAGPGDSPIKPPLPSNVVAGGVNIPVSTASDNQVPPDQQNRQRDYGDAERIRQVAHPGVTSDPTTTTPGGTSIPDPTTPSPLPGSGVPSTQPRQGAPIDRGANPPGPIDAGGGGMPTPSGITDPNASPSNNPIAVTPPTDNNPLGGLAADSNTGFNPSGTGLQM